MTIGRSVREVLSENPRELHQPLCRQKLTWRPENLTPLYFFLWGYLKSVVYQGAPEILGALKQAIRAAIRQIPPPHVLA